MSDFAAPIVTPRGNNKYDVSYGDDKQLFVEFFTQPEFQEFESNKEGRAIYKEIEMIRIFMAGKNAPTIRRVVTATTPNQKSDAERWPSAYAAFKNQTKIVHDGISIETWPPITKSDVLNFKALNIHTVEQLANVTDANLASLGLGGRVIRDKAIAYVAALKGDGKEVMKLTAENATLKADVEMLKKQVAEISQQKDKNNGKKE